MAGLCVTGNWIEVKDGDCRARAIMQRHYSARHYHDGRNPRLFVGPGQKMVLLTLRCDALFVWRKFIDDAVPHQDGVNCAVFRREAGELASVLIKEAIEIAHQCWPGERLYTYVDPKKIRHKRDPGRCFIKAGFKRCPYLTKTDKIVLELNYGTKNDLSH